MFEFMQVSSKFKVGCGIVLQTVDFFITFVRTIWDFCNLSHVFQFIRTNSDLLTSLMVGMYVKHTKEVRGATDF